MHLGKRAFKIPDQLGEAPLYRALPRDQNIIIAFQGVSGACEPYRLFEPAARAIADDSAAQSLHCREAEAGKLTLIRLAVALARLQYERGHHKSGTAPYMQEFRACLETSDRCHR